MRIRFAPINPPLKNSEEMKKNRLQIMNINHDIPLGGKLEACFSPPITNLMNLAELRAVHSPFQFFNFKNASSSLRSGIQKPVLNSFSSVCVLCDRASSRRRGGRPLRLSCWSCASSSPSRLMHLLIVKTSFSPSATAIKERTGLPGRPILHQSKAHRYLERHCGSIQCAPLVES